MWFVTKKLVTCKRYLMLHDTSHFRGFLSGDLGLLRRLGFKGHVSSHSCLDVQYQNARFVLLWTARRKHPSQHSDREWDDDATCRDVQSCLVFVCVPFWGRGSDEGGVRERSWKGNRQALRRESMSMKTKRKNRDVIRTVVDYSLIAFLRMDIRLRE